MNNILQDIQHLPWEMMRTDIFNKYREVFGEAFLFWKQDAPHTCFNYYGNLLLINKQQGY